MITNHCLSFVIMNAKTFIITLVSIVVFGSIIRFVALDQYPPQLNRDEAALALNARLIAQTGFDEWHHHLPLQFQSFGDYKLPGYIYLLSGLFLIHTSDVVVRLPSALAGMGIVITLLFWAQNVLKFPLSRASKIVLLLSISLSPFAMFYSRMAWEANLSLFLMLSALTLLHSQKPTLHKDLLALLIYFAAILTYNSAYILLPFIAFSVVLSRGINKYRFWLLPLASFLVIFTISSLILMSNNSQKSGILIFSDGAILDTYPKYRQSFPNVLRPVVGNKYVYFSQIAATHYLQTFSPYFLITHGGQHPWHSILGKGHIFYSTYVLFLIGVMTQLSKAIYFLKMRHKWKKLSTRSIIPFFLLIVSPLPSIFTTDAPHATRSLFTFIMIIVFSAIGGQHLLSTAAKHSFQLRKAVITILLGLLIFEGANYLNSYFIVWPHQFSPDFQLGLKQKITDEVLQPRDGNIGILDTGEYVYASVAWYARLQPQLFFDTIERSGPSVAGLYTVTRVGKYYFIPDKNIAVPYGSEVLTPTKSGWEWQ